MTKADLPLAQEMTLALVIPVWNDQEGLARLLAQVPQLDVFSQVIVVDDASDVPSLVGTPDLGSGCQVQYIKLTEQRGAGYARNRGLDLVTTSHVIFFDSDDVFTPEFCDIIADLKSTPNALAADFTIFRHVDSRVRDRGGYGPLEADQAFWEQSIGPVARDGAAGLVGLSRAGAVQLCRIAAYPWNKIYRTAFLRKQKIRCTEIPVHNDVELHWTSFLKAGRILCSPRIGCVHFVHEAGQRLTNRTGEERLRVFEALGNLQDAMEARPERLEFLEAYAEFVMRLCNWIVGTLAAEFHAPFRAKMRKFLLSRITPDLFTLIATRNPALADRIISTIRQQAR